MDADSFIQKWRYSINYLNLPTVGIHVGWDIIPKDSKVETFNGSEAWNKLYMCTPPWFEHPQTFKSLVTAKNSDYLDEIKKETGNGKVEYYRRNGLPEPFFCVFANPTGSFMLLGDGNHRFLNCIYLIDAERQNFDKDIERAYVDVIYLQNYKDVLLTNAIWKHEEDKYE